MKKNLSVADIMTKKVITFTLDTHVLSAIDKLISKKISGAPVVDEDGKILGMLRSEEHTSELQSH